jgi:hypothetical protein
MLARNVICSIEMEIRKYFRGTGEEQYDEKSKEVLRDNVCSDVDVKYYWDIIMPT